VVHFLIHETGIVDRRKRLGVQQLDTSPKKANARGGGWKWEKEGRCGIII
jgi:hypothetical protein